MRQRLRPVDLAREHGLSTQAIRNYEDAAILPPARRTESGYRVYTPAHAQALRAFLALLAGHGHATATAVLNAVHRDDLPEALSIVDHSHLQLLEDRRTLHAVERALRDLTGDLDRLPAQVLRAGIHPLSVGEIAHQLGVRPSTIRSWEKAGLQPARDPATGYRVYAAADVRDARLIHQLRRGGYLLEQIAPLLARVRAAGGTEPLQATVTEWRTRLDARARAMLTGAAQLDAYLRMIEAGDGPEVSGRPEPRDRQHRQHRPMRCVTDQFR